MRIPRLSRGGATLLVVALIGAFSTAVAVAFIDTPQQGTTAPGAHEFRVVDAVASCSRCHDGTFPHFLHDGQSCTTCHGGGHVATVATCLDCHGGHDGPVPLAACTVCHEDNGGSLVTGPNDHETMVDPSQCVWCHEGGGGFAPGTTVPPSSTTVPPSSTTVPPSSTTVPPSSTTVPPSSTTVPPSSTTVPPSSTTTTTTTTTLPPTTTTTTTQPPGNQAPIADAGSSRSVLVGEFATFDATNSADSDGSIMSYLWDFGDGTTSTSDVVSHSYAVAGTYTVVLTVTDDGGLTGVDAVVVSVGG